MKEIHVASNGPFLKKCFASFHLDCHCIICFQLYVFWNPLVFVCLVSQTLLYPFPLSLPPENLVHSPSLSPPPSLVCCTMHDNLLYHQPPVPSSLVALLWVNRLVLLRHLNLPNCVKKKPGLFPPMSKSMPAWLFLKVRLNQKYCKFLQKKKAS